MTHPSLWSDDVSVQVVETLAKLDAFGTPQQVADFLIAEGVRGSRRASRTCPIAQWLRRATGESVCVAPGMWNIASLRGFRRGGIPPVVAAFIAQFDA